MSTRGQVIGTSHSDSHSRLWMTVGRSVSVKFARMTWRSEWTPHLVLRECLMGIIITKPKRGRGEESEDEEAPKWRGFRAGVDLRLGAIDTTTVNKKRGRKRKTIRKVPSYFRYNKYIEKRVRMHGKCMNMWHAKQIASWAQPNPNLSAHKQIAHI